MVHWPLFQWYPWISSCTTKWSFSAMSKRMIPFVCYFFFPLFQMLSLALCGKGVCCKVVNTVHQQLDEIVHISCVRIVLSTLSHWLYGISPSISNSINLFLMNFSRAGYPGQFLQRCNMHSRLVVSHITIPIKSLYLMSNFGTSTLLFSDSSAFLFNWVFTVEQKQSTINLMFWWWVQTHTECVPDDDTVTRHLGRSSHNFEKPILQSGIFTESSFRLLKGRRFCTWTLLPLFTKPFPPGIMLENSSFS